MNERFLERSVQYEPKLHHRICESFSYGSLLPDNKKWFGYRFEQSEAPESMVTGDSCNLDFGEHLVGYLSFNMKCNEFYPDAPVRLYIKFAENLYELAYDFEKYKQKAEGLSSTWLQEQVIYVDEPGKIDMSRRYAFRYVKITAEKTNVPICLEDFTVKAVTSADMRRWKPLQIEDEELGVVSPYMHHYVVEALIRVELYETAVQYVKSYWGTMVKLGADTFWEVFVPGYFKVSPYGDSVMNSACHAWSCSAAYFIRKYFRKK